MTQSEISSDWHVYSGHRALWRDNFGDSTGSLRAEDPLEACKTKAWEKLVRYMQAVRKIAGEFDASEEPTIAHTEKEIRRQGPAGPSSVVPYLSNRTGDA